MTGEETGENFTTLSSEELIEAVGDAEGDEKESLLKRVIGTLAGRLFNWGQRKSLYPLHLGIKCCALEMAAAGAPRFDAERFGVFFRSSPRQSDVLLVNGPVSKKFAPYLQILWEQMPEPKWCIAMGECAISGGPYYQSYNILEGVDTIIPVDVYIPGCPPRPEALIEGFDLLRMQIIQKGKGPNRPGTKAVGVQKVGNAELKEVGASVTPSKAPSKVVWEE